jgi:DNA-binding transcriptional regulator YiaG
MTKKNYPRTRVHTAELVSREPLKIRFFSNDSPQRVQRWARKNLKRAGVRRRDAYLDLLEYKAGNPVIQDIAWCEAHAAGALQALEKIPQAFRSSAILACRNMFQAGKRHESFDEFQKHAPAIDERKTRENQRAGAREKSADARRKITAERYAMVSGLTREQKAEKLGVSPQAVAKWERKTGRR